jgi:hypothetical protein
LGILTRASKDVNSTNKFIPGPSVFLRAAGYSGGAGKALILIKNAPGKPEAF